MRLILKIILVLTISFVFVQTGVAQNKLSVFVSIVPQKYFVEQIGQDLVDVRVMVQPDTSPATYEPKPSQMAALTKAKIYFSIGVPFENSWLKKIAASNPALTVIPTDHGIDKLAMKRHSHSKDEQNSHEDHGQSGTPDPHIWTSPPLVMMQAHKIVTALQKADPANRSAYQTRYKAFISELVDLDGDLRNIFAEKQGQRFMVFHPSWGYFAHTYGLQQTPVEIEGKSPKPAQLKALIKYARQHAIKVIFVQPQFSSKSAQLIAREIGGRVAIADPLAADWPANLRELAKTFQTVLK
ncbi:zinc ABC transporter substrate-binding protein [Desulfococcaceae bacterium HSG9]|nr:zinc ABC transporter substrate-binding protein [Desulfococcaceae bacterium HSG9]